MPSKRTWLTTITAATLFLWACGGRDDTMTAQLGAVVPHISSLAPSSAMAGGGDFKLDVFGSNFSMNSVIRWNGANLPTGVDCVGLGCFESAPLAALVPAANISSRGSAEITVFNPGGGSSNALTFSIQ